MKVKIDLGGGVAEIFLAEKGAASKLVWETLSLYPILKIYPIYFYKRCDIPYKLSFRFSEIIQGLSAMLRPMNVHRCLCAVLMSQPCIYSIVVHDKTFFLF